MDRLAQTSQSLPTDQGSSDKSRKKGKTPSNNPSLPIRAPPTQQRFLYREPPVPRDASQSLPADADQGSSDVEIAINHSAEALAGSQSLPIDQGSSDGLKAETDTVFVKKGVAIPPYRSGQFRPVISSPLPAHSGGNPPSQSLHTDQGSSDQHDGRTNELALVREESQSLHTDQAVPTASKLHHRSAPRKVAIPPYRSGQFRLSSGTPSSIHSSARKSQSLHTDQGSSDRDTSGSPQVEDRRVAIPPYRSGLLRPLYQRHFDPATNSVESSVPIRAPPTKQISM